MEQLLGLPAPTVGDEGRALLGRVQRERVSWSRVRMPRILQNAVAFQQIRLLCSESQRAGSERAASGDARAFANGLTAPLLRLRSFLFSSTDRLSTPLQTLFTSFCCRAECPLVSFRSSSRDATWQLNASLLLSRSHFSDLSLCKAATTHPSTYTFHLPPHHPPYYPHHSPIQTLSLSPSHPHPRIPLKFASNKSKETGPTFEVSS